jgi:26 proteasome complex subunit DSS1
LNFHLGGKLEFKQIIEIKKMDVEGKKDKEQPVVVGKVGENNFDEDDDDFEEFEAEDWEKEKNQEQIGVKQWQEDWDDEDIDTDFAKELKQELHIE